MDVKGKIKGDINLMKMVSAQVFEEMGITVVEVEPQQDKSAENYIKGKTDKHEIIEVVWEPVTPKMFSVGAKARYPGIGFFETNKDINFAIEIISLIDAEYRAGITASKEVNKIMITVTKSNIRKGPGKDYKIIAVSKKGTELEFLGKSGNWVKVKTVSGKVGYVYNTLVQGKI